jgi:phosphatidylglycerol:prolipoprotein diacylglycerol transferase
MAPDLFHSMPLYPAFLVASCLLGSASTMWMASRCGVPRRPMIGLLALVTMCALAGAKLYGIGERWGGWHGLAWEIGHGYRYPGGILAALVALPLLARTLMPRVSLAALGDVAVVGVGVAMAVMRIGCFLAGCCHGLPSSLPWAVVFPKGSLAWETQVRSGLIEEHAAASLPVHPLQLYFLLASLAVAVFLLWYRSRQRYEGELVLLFFVLDGTAKFLLEFLRFEYAAHLQWMAAAMAVVGAVVWVSGAGCRVSVGAGSA